MIIKNLSRKSGSGQLINYIFRYILNDEKQPVESPFVIRHNVRSRDIQGYIREFKENARHRTRARKNQVAIHHTILSWSNKDRDRLTPEKINKMARQYMSLRGLNNLYVGTIHTDRDHIHLHLAMSATELSGRTSRISKSEFANLKLSLDAYQREQFPELEHSLPDHGKAKTAVLEPHIVEQDVEVERPITEEMEKEILETDLNVQSETEILLADDDVFCQEEITLEEHELSALLDIRQRASLHIDRELDFDRY